MSAFFARKVSKVCQLPLKESFEVSKCMVRACKEAFPKFHKDLKSKFTAAYEKENVKTGKKKGVIKHPDLYEFRQSLHIQLKRKTTKKENFR